MDDFRGRGILYLETRKKKLESVNAPEYSLLGGGEVWFGVSFHSIKRKESPAQRARASRFFNVFSKENRRESNCETRSAIGFVRFCLICGCLFLILGSYGRNIGVLSERYGVSMGTLLELDRSNRGPRSLAPSLTPLVVQLPLPVIELFASTNMCEARASASPPYVFA